MPASSKAVILPAGVDLHARPAATLVRAAMRFQSRTTVAAGDREVDVKSLLSVLGLGAKAGTELTLTADGPDADEALAALVDTIATLSE